VNQEDATLTIQINTSNAAFQDNFKNEITLILHRIIRELNDDRLPTSGMTLRDSNGNDVGAAYFDAVTVVPA